MSLYQEAERILDMLDNTARNNDVDSLVGYVLFEHSLQNLVALSCLLCGDRIRLNPEGFHI